MTLWLFLLRSELTYDIFAKFDFRLETHNLLFTITQTITQSWDLIVFIGDFIDERFDIAWKLLSMEEINSVNGKFISPTCHSLLTWSLQNCVTLIPFSLLVSALDRLELPEESSSLLLLIIDVDISPLWVFPLLSLSTTSDSTFFAGWQLFARSFLFFTFEFLHNVVSLFSWSSLQHVPLLRSIGSPLCNKTMVDQSMKLLFFLSPAFYDDRPTPPKHTIKTEILCLITQSKNTWQYHHENVK